MLKIRVCEHFRRKPKRFVDIRSLIRRDENGKACFINKRTGSIERAPQYDKKK